MIALRLPAFCATPDNFRAGGGAASGIVGSITVGSTPRSRAALDEADNLGDAYLNGLRVDGRSVTAPVRLRSRAALALRSSAVGSFADAGRRTAVAGAVTGTL